MDLFNVLDLIGGLALFLFGMNLMGQALERRAGSGLKNRMEKLTGNRVSGLLTGLCVTAVIQSSSATTVIVVGFVNSGIMTLRQSINVIMGANIGTTVTAWLLSLTGINSSNLFVSLLKPSSWTPVLALAGIILYLMAKSDKKKDTGLAFLGFAVLMFGMETMSASVSGLADVPGFRQMFLAFQNPFLGVLMGAVLTAIIQSSSASVGILQALSTTGSVTYASAIPIIMGQNIGTCVTALISSIGTTKNARRAALVHLSFNMIGTAVWLTVYCLIRRLVQPVFLSEPATLLGIAIFHTLFNVLCTIIMFPLGGFLEKLVCHLIPDREPVVETPIELDERLLTAPSLALEQCRRHIVIMAENADRSCRDSLSCLDRLTPEHAESVRSSEERTDHEEDIIGTYLVKLSARQINEEDSAVASEYLKVIGDLERIADHSLDILKTAEEMRAKEIVFTAPAKSELGVLTDAVREITDLSVKALSDNDLEAAGRVEPLCQVIGDLKDNLRNHHIDRLQRGECSIEAGFVWADLLTSLERISDHCSNVAACVIDTTGHTLNIHESMRLYRQSSDDFRQTYHEYREKYRLLSA